MSKKVEIGSKFKNICFLGLNRVEYFPEQSEESIFADTWQDVTDEHSRRSLALLFFAPRDLDGEPVDPYIFLTEGDDGDEQSVLIAQQAFGDIPLIDMCRLRSKSPNEVHILVTADIIFHWDYNDSYIQPTSAITWVRDIQNILKTYPRTTERYIYTNWENNRISEIGATIRPLRELEIDEEAWVNMPSFQEKHGFAVMFISIVTAILVYLAIFIQGTDVDELSRQIRTVDLETPSGKSYTELNRAIIEQQKFMRYRGLAPFITSDIANAIQRSGMKIHSFQIKTPDAQKPAETLIVTIKAQKDAYKGWLEEEPISKALLGQSVTLSAIRRPPGGSQFMIEGLIELEPISQMLSEYQEDVKRMQQQTIRAATQTKTVTETTDEEGEK
tara:strand:- start:254139 stop:255299 length:1161 start_codon:yes stop_codon:yes gene_type:complete